MNIIIFNKVDNSYHMACSDIPNQDYLDTSKWIITYLPEGETFDPTRSYSVVDGAAVKGDLIPIDAAMIAEVAAEEYKVKRRDEYPTIEDQLDDIYHNGVDAWKATIKITKDKYPKG